VEGDAGTQQDNIVAGPDRRIQGAHVALVRELSGTPIDYPREDFTRILPGGFDVVFDGIGEDCYRRSFAALKPGGLLTATRRVCRRSVGCSAS
jgi:NADPH:quinone reductase-like Zn-dependent oxidoreductase